MNLFIMNALATGTTSAPTTGAAGGAAGMIVSIIPLVLMLGVMYLILIRPQRKRDKLTKEMLAGLIVGDKIVTIGGIHGKIVTIKDEELIIETGSATEKSNIKVSRWAVREVVKPAEA